ncbi:oxygen-independent coproporphyrinogen III oxidase [Spartinivicinus poritis]|uniref:Coproporphyrinogen-III oxidase n=1 Tax=Spartinivicinus poritis TaxID=2994640 RepID=A0ABT5UC31_9GAMM|nr:oxygen-independent coproporphyrinogen III oxidase [Spartinivicinus sp. A2-2]MDE1463940.1 oxygen-independent coproporphyrinogen III oxidase [Spartinivicinus sp. A2-2]
MLGPLKWQSSLIERYNQQGPRYTSYPTAVEFSESFEPDHYQQALTKLKHQQTPLSLYVHIPFCASVCYYCGCNKIITKNRQKALPYLTVLEKEIQLISQQLDCKPVVEQLHWGGGTPTFLTHEQTAQLFKLLEQHFQLVDDIDGDYSIEIDPREADWPTMGLLRSLGFNRISLGIQDFNPVVQKAVNRVQSEAETEAIFEAARALLFKSINVDLIYGLPFQTTTSFLETLDKVIALSPDRLSIFNYAHLPHRFKPQRRIKPNDLPSATEKLSILQHSIDRLQAAGYHYIGMDHFALPDDKLAIAQAKGELHRNFQGYTTHGHCDLIGLGVSSISQIGDVYCQNHTALDDYIQSIENNQLPIKRGFRLNQDDLLRRSIIQQLICHFQVDLAEYCQPLGINWHVYFREEIMQLMPMLEDGLITLADSKLTITNNGRLLARNICMVFDRYLASKQSTENLFSKVI